MAVVVQRHMALPGWGLEDLARLASSQRAVTPQQLDCDAVIQEAPLLFPLREVVARHLRESPAIDSPESASPHMKNAQVPLHESTTNTHRPRYLRWKRMKPPDMLKHEVICVV